MGPLSPVDESCNCGAFLQSQNLKRSVILHDSGKAGKTRQTRCLRLDPACHMEQEEYFLPHHHLWEN